MAKQVNNAETTLGSAGAEGSFHVLRPGRYMGVALQEDDVKPFEVKIQRLVAQLRQQQSEGASWIR